VLPELGRELGARAVYASEDVGPFARRRTDAARRALDCPLMLHPGVAIVDDLEAVTTRAGRPYKRRGECWFMRWLVDGDEANSNGNWQWIASVGVDPQPIVDLGEAREAAFARFVQDSR
jgi:FAD binding domain of DNA photolyase